MGATETVYLGRQPILNTTGCIIAYELLFRTSTVNAAQVSNDAQATSHVVATMLGAFGIGTVLGPHVGYINVNREVLLGELTTVLPPQRFVLEVLETVEFDEILLARCRTLRAAGFRLALDDVASSEGVPAELLREVDVVKIDYSLVTRADMPPLIAKVRASGRVALAEKVETAEDFEHARALGFDLFQGYYFARPEVLSTRRMVLDHAALVRLLGLLGRETELIDIEAELKRIPKLIVQLLRFANSSGRSRRATTLREATLAVGTRQIARWAQLLLYASDDANFSVETDPVFQLVGTRARFMELAAETLSPHDEQIADDAFMTGVFSLADAMFGSKGVDVLQELQLQPAIEQALCHRIGELGMLLDCAEAVESGDFGRLQAACERIGGFDPRTASRLAFEAQRWVTRHSHDAAAD